MLVATTPLQVDRFLVVAKEVDLPSVIAAFWATCKICILTEVKPRATIG